MKKVNFKYLTLMAAALLLGFSSCGNDDETGGETDGTKRVFLKISGNRPATYSESAPQGETTVEFATGHLYFIDPLGRIVEHYTLSSEESGDHNLKIDEMIDGKAAVLDVPMSVVDVYIVGNVPAGVNIPVTGNISAVKALALGVETQKNTGNVGLYGFDKLLAPSEEGQSYTANITLKPIVARIELPEIKAKNSDITSFTIDGIFVDNFHVSGQVSGDLPSLATLVTSSDDPAKYDNNVRPYLTAYKQSVYDWYDPGFGATGNPLLVKPDNGNVWGYNLFATLEGSDVPRIIIRLSDVTTTTKTYPTPMFLTVNGFIAGGTQLFSIESGKVYQIAPVEFLKENLSEQPAKSTINVAVSITLAKWKTVPIQPVIW
jgi:hypothetical protein